MRTRRKLTSKFKSRVVLALLNGGKTVTEVCRKYELTAQMVNGRQAQFLTAAPQVLEIGGTAAGKRNESPNSSRWSTN